MRIQKRHNMCPFTSLHPLEKGKEKVIKSKRQIHKISKMGNKKKKKKSFKHLVPKVVIDLHFEGSWKYRSRERVPKEGSRREETITEGINSCTGVFRTIVCVRTKGGLEPTLQTFQFHYILIRMKKVC